MCCNQQSHDADEVFQRQALIMFSQSLSHILFANSSGAILKPVLLGLYL